MRTVDASGRYTYRLNGEAQDLDETFDVVTVDGVTTVTGVRRAPAHGVLLEVTASFASGFVHGEVVLDRGDGPVVRASYELLGNEVVCRRGGRTEAALVDDPAEVFMLMRVFQGRVVARAAEGSSGLNVVVPDVRPQTEAAGLLAPLVDLRTATTTADGTYDYHGGSYEAGATVDVRDGLMRRYTWDQPDVGTWDVRLSKLQGEVRPLSW